MQMRLCKGQKEWDRLTHGEFLRHTTRLPESMVEVVRCVRSRVLEHLRTKMYRKTTLFVVLGGTFGRHVAVTNALPLPFLKSLLPTAANNECSENASETDTLSHGL